MFLLEGREEALATRRMPEEEHGGLREGPLQMHVPHLGAAGAEGLAARLFAAFHQPRIRGEFLHAIKPRDVVNLIEDRQRQDLADARDGSEAMEGVGIVLFAWRTGSARDRR